MINETETTLKLRKSHERGHSNLGWLKSHHTFSFGEYHDPSHMGYRKLRVINDDTVAPGQGFGTHPHKNMEIFSYVIDGELKHQDSLGNGRIIRAGQFQYMSAGAGVLHSEFNPSENNSAHFLQIWIQPKTPGGEPKYADMDTNLLKKQNALSLFASPDGRDESMSIRAEAEILFGSFSADQSLAIPADDLLPYHWLHLISGKLSVNGLSLNPGDAISSEEAVNLQIEKPSEFLLFKLE